MSGILDKLFGGNDQQEVVPDNAIRPVHVTDDEFEELVLGSPVPVIVDFWAPWCMPCRMIAPTLDKIAAEYGERVLVAKVNTDVVRSSL